MIKKLSLLGVAISGLVMADPAYNPVGPQTNVSIASVLAGGWSICYAGDYGLSNVSIASVLGSCSPSGRLMMAAQQNATTDFAVLAQALFSQVTQVTAFNTTHNANGAYWYFNNNSWGFTPVATISQNSADTTDAPGFGGNLALGAQKISWHTAGVGPGPSNLNGGWRSGNTTFLNSEPSGYTRYLLQANASAVPEPATNAMIGLGFAALAVVARRRRS